jgi:CTD small phosphatase-like protein 2
LRKVNLARSILDRSKKTLVIDIDDTLIHCSDSALFPYDIMVPIKANCSTTQVYITIRPYTISFLKRISKMYEIIAFTTMHKADADAAIDEIDPNH